MADKKASRKGAAALAETAQKAILDDINASIDKDSHAATFACGGSVTKSVTIRFGESGSGQVIRLPGQPSSQDTQQLDLLIKACQSATFGLNGEAVLDESYRKAAKLDSTEFDTSFCPYETGIIDIVAQMLLPNYAKERQGRGVRAELYKLNVYSGPSGRFRYHVDMPRGENQFASLVVVLPVAYAGGELVVCNSGKEIVFDWSTGATAIAEQVGLLASESKASKLTNDLKWAPFYSDCEHEVLEVTSGHRATLTYNLYITKGAGLLAGHAAALDATQLPLYKVLSEALDNPGFLKHGRVLGIYLAHRYPHTNPKISFLPRSLKGVDMALYESVRALGLKCLVAPVGRVYGRDGREVAAGTKFHKLKAKNSRANDGGEVDKLLQRYWPHTYLNGRKMTWLSKKLHQQLVLAYVACDYEPSLATHYSSAALLVRIPRFSKRGEALVKGDSLFADVKADPGGHEDYDDVYSEEDCDESKEEDISDEEDTDEDDDMEVHWH